MPESERKHNLFLHALLIGIIVSIVTSFYLFFYKKDFNFIVETKCNPDTDTCFYRDCTNPDDCPPNGFSYYNIYTLKASDFKACINEDCTDACTTGVIKCLKTECTSDDLTNGLCTSPEDASNIK